MKNTIEFLKTREDGIATYEDVRSHLGLDNSVKKLFKTQEFQRFMKGDVRVPYRTVYPEAEETEETEEETEGSETIRGILSKFWQEIRNFRKYFNINDCAEGIVLKVFLPANDIISDFLFARNLFRSTDPRIKQWFTFFAYYFTAWPGVMFLLSNISQIIFCDSG